MDNGFLWCVDLLVGWLLLWLIVVVCVALINSVVVEVY